MADPTFGPFNVPLSDGSVLHIAGGSLTPAPTPAPAPPPVPAPASSGFVTRDTTTGNLMLNGSRFRAAGPNIYWLQLAEYAGIRFPTHAEIDAVLADAQSMNAKVIRSHSICSVGGPLTIQPTRGNFVAANFEAIDYAISVCKTKGIKLILVLVDNYSYYLGGKFTYLGWRGVNADSVGSQFFTDPTVLSDFKAHITAVLTHVNQYTGVAYKDEPTILAWETGNELSVYPNVWNYTAWTDAVSRHIKVTLGARQLVMDGKYGPYTSGTTLDVSALQLPYVDIYSQHSYDNFRTPAEIDSEATKVKGFNKAFMLGEFDWTGSAGWSLSSMLSTVESGKTDLDCFWSLFCAGKSGDRFTLHWPGDTTDMATRATQLKNHAANFQ